MQNRKKSIFGTIKELKKQSDRITPQINNKISTRLNNENIPKKDGAKIKAVLISEIKSGKTTEEGIDIRLTELIKEFDTKSVEINKALKKLEETFVSEEVQNKIKEYKLNELKTIKIKNDLKKGIENESINEKEILKKIHENLNLEHLKEVEMGISGYDFSCTLYEIRQGTFGKNEDVVKGYCFIEKDKLTIKKISSWLKHDKGNKIIPFSNINAIDYDKAGGLQLTSSIVIGISGIPPIVLRHTSEKDFELLHQAWLDYKNPSNKEPVLDQGTVETKVSSADELMKYAELYEKGLLTEEEFNEIKKKLLGL